MKRIFILFFLLGIFSENFCQEALTLSKSISVENVKKKKILKDISAVLNSNHDFSNFNSKKDDEISVNGFLTYKNPVKFENSLNLTRSYAQQTDGKIEFILQVIVQDNQYTIKMSHIRHIPDNHLNNICFGIITDSDTAPRNIIEEVGEKWTNEVWADIKSQVQKKFEDINSSIKNNYVSVN